MRRWRCTSRFGPCGKGVRIGPHRQFAKKHFHFGGKRAILYNRIGEMNSSGAARRLRNGQFCRFNSHPARGRKYKQVEQKRIIKRTNSHPARGRKQYGKDVALAGTWDLTHTPQGDGDNLPNVSSSNSEDLTHTPQGDVNSACVMLRKHIKNQLTPRKGTITPQCSLLQVPSQESTHTPQGDGSPSR